MNARQKCKHLKKQLTALYEDYVTSAMIANEVMNVAAANMQKMRDQQVLCSFEKQFNEPVEINEDIAIEFMEQLTYDEKFRRSVIFAGHTDQDTGKYILRAELTVVLPEGE